MLAGLLSRNDLKVFIGALTVLSCILLAAAAPEPANTSRLVRPGPGGKLAYAAYTQKGDLIPDFSYCGYMRGGVAIPDLAVKATVAPEAAPTDDTARIRAAIDQVAALAPDGNGLRGAVLLKKGKYKLGGPLRIAAAGVVLRGEGQGEDGTVLVDTLRRQNTMISLGGSGAIREVQGTRQGIADEYVPVGARSFNVADASGFKVGDAVIVLRPSTEEWIHTLTMDAIKAKGGKIIQWRPGAFDLASRRIVEEVHGNRVTIDAPLTNAIQKEFGGGFIYKFTYPGMIRNVGVENLRGESEFASPTDEQHGWNMISFGAVWDGWARNVTSVHFGYSCVNIGSPATRVTVQDSQCLDPISQIIGGRRYSFDISGQMNLVQRCITRGGRHDYVMSARIAGPNAFVLCKSTQVHADSGPHHRWSTGTLYDCIQTDGEINVQDRQASGTGHGWAGAQMVFWNCTAKKIICQQPPTAQNFAIGCVAQKGKGTWKADRPDGWWESQGKAVAPRSLYLKQLEDRLGKGAVAAIGYKE